jgi:hypothetical protein
MNSPHRPSSVRTLTPVSQAPSTPARDAIDRAAVLRLGGYSFLILFFELAFIRYTSGYVRIFGFYLNLVLIATFLGMGVGLLRAGRADLVRWIAPLALLALVTAVWFLSRTAVVPGRTSGEYVWGLFMDAPNVRRIGTLPVVVGLFTLCALFFVPLGALMGREFRRLPGLIAYSADIAGSLLGIAAFGIASAAGTTPFLWFAAGLALWIVLSLRERAFAWVLAVTAVGALACVWATAVPGEQWSPYYRISVSNSELGPSGRPMVQTLWVNGSIHQYAVAFDSATFARMPVLRGVHAAYQRPYARAARLDTALVVGAGTGNDVALLLEAGARHVDAVEIDPVILRLGRERHAMRPYDDPRAHPILGDARSYMRRTARKYDVIVFGTLDSQTLLSGMSSVRLDNYVYTVESFRAARSLLKPHGVLIVYHMSAFPFIEAKIYQMIGAAFGRMPAATRDADGFFNLTVIADARPDAAAPASVPASVLGDVALPRDDWPYLYLTHATIPSHYLIALGCVLAIGVLFTWTAGGVSMRGGFDGGMFFMGAGFMLVETKSVTEMSLLFGSTWTVNLLVFGSILVVILLANAFTLRGRVWPVSRLFAALFAALAVAVAVPASALLSLGIQAQWLLGGVLVASPILLAALIFAALLRRSSDPARALAYNVMGAIAGGVLEYSSMALGIKALYLLAAVAYGAAFLFVRSRLDGAQSSTEVPAAAVEHAA